MTVTDLGVLPWQQTLLRPRSVAIVGASSNPQKTSGAPARFLRLHRFAGELHLVNPRVRQIDGLATVRSISELPTGVDLAVLMVPEARVRSVIEECDVAGVRTAVVCATGMASVDRPTRHKGGLRLLGPNSQGLANLFDRMVATFSHSAGRTDLVTGPTAILSQSGAVAGVLWDLLASHHVGIGYWVSTGNEWDLDLADLVAAVSLDDRVERIVLYVEGVRRGEEFLEALDQCRERSVEVLVLKAGRSPLGAQATATHTAAAAGDYEVFVQLCQSRGAVVLDSLDQVVSACVLEGVSRGQPQLTDQPGSGAGVGIVSSSGGFGALLVDRLHDKGLRPASLATPTVETLSTVLDAGGSPVNPVDLTAAFLGVLGAGGHDSNTHPPDPRSSTNSGVRSVWSDVCEVLAADPDVGIVVAVVSMVTGRAGDVLAAELLELSAGLGKPLAVVWLGGDLTEPYRRRLRDAGVAVVANIDAMVDGIALDGPRHHAVRTNDQRNTPPATVAGSPARGERAGAGRFLSDVDALQLLEAAGVPLPRWHPASTATEAEKVAATWGCDVVVKGVAAGIAHKSAAGLVRVKVAPGDVGKAHAEIGTTAIAGGHSLTCVLVQEYVAHTGEILVGLRRDPAFGAVLVLGAGGTNAGAGIAVSISPLSRQLDDASTAVRRAAGRTALGELPPDALAGVAEVVHAVGDMFLRSPHLAEVEVNPLVIRERPNLDGDVAMTPGRAYDVLALDCLASFF